jgi:hypothetical protein
MSALTKYIQRLCSKDWFLALLLLGIFMVTNRYIYGWDDQHLEIPLLKKLIDPTLYPGDYYVESLVANFTSYLYIILSKIITVDQIPAAYFVLFLISRFFLFFWSFKLWDLVARKYFGGESAICPPRVAAFCAVAMSFLVGRTEEFLYRTFSHQEFALAIIMAAIYYFFKDRYLIAAALFGIAANFHALYALFPMVYMSVYLLFFHPEKRIFTTFKAGMTFIAACLPFLLWAIPKNIALHGKIPPEVTANWIEIYYLACPYNFLFGDARLEQVMSSLKLFVTKTNLLITVASLYLIHLILNPPFRSDRKMHAIAASAAFLLSLCFYFGYIHPLRFSLDLNLVRNDQYLRFLLMGYTTVFVLYKIHEKSVWNALLLSVMFMALWFRGSFGPLLAAGTALLYIAVNWQEIRRSWQMWKLTTAIGVLALLFILVLFGTDYATLRTDKLFVNAVVGAALLVVAALEIFRSIRNRTAFVALPLALTFLFFCYYHYQFVQVSTRGGGFWQMQRNWEDMQFFVRDYTPKDAYIMTPYNMEMGGFRIHSERKLLVSYRDCGIVGFDYLATLDWYRRIKDIESFRVFTDPKSIAPAMVNAFYKYKVDYIVFMRYYAPGDNELVRKVYENEVFTLHQVIAQK